jgi:hypothetical protein
MEQGATDLEDMQTATTLFAVSFRQRDEIAAILANAGAGAGAGWHAAIVDDADALESRFLASGAAVAVRSRTASRRRAGLVGWSPPTVRRCWCWSRAGMSR